VQAEPALLNTCQLISRSQTLETVKVFTIQLKTPSFQHGCWNPVTRRA